MVLEINYAATCLCTHSCEYVEQPQPNGSSSFASVWLTQPNGSSSFASVWLTGAIVRTSALAFLRRSFLTLTQMIRRLIAMAWAPSNASCGQNCSHAQFVEKTRGVPRGMCPSLLRQMTSRDFSKSIRALTSSMWECAINWRPRRGESQNPFSKKNANLQLANILHWGISKMIATRFCDSGACVLL